MLFPQGGGKVELEKAAHIGERKHGVTTVYGTPIMRIVVLSVPSMSMLFLQATLLYGAD